MSDELNLSDFDAMSKTLQSLHASICRIVTLAHAPHVKWETKYDLAFKVYRQTIRPAIDALGLSFDYYDPDTTYQEDTMALVYALEMNVLPEVVGVMQAWGVPIPTND